MTRLNLTLPKKLENRLNAYLVKIVQRNGKIPHAIKQKIGLMALEEWLDKHENDLTIKF